MNSTELFSKTSPLKLFFTASIPGAVSMFASALYYTIEGIFVGHFLGETALEQLPAADKFVGHRPFSRKITVPLQPFRRAQPLEGS